MKRLLTFMTIFLIVSSSIPIVLADDSPTDQFYDVDCKDSMNRLKKLAKDLIAIGWTFSVIGHISGDSFYTFFYGEDEFAMGDVGYYRHGYANYDNCGDDEYYSLMWNPQTQKWDKEVVEQNKYLSTYSSVVAGTLLLLLVVGVISISIYSGGSGSAGGSNSGGCYIRIIPTFCAN